MPQIPVFDFTRGSATTNISCGTVLELGGQLVPISSYLTHPFFLDIPELIAFEDRVWGYVSAGAAAGDRSADDHLNADSGAVFQGRWLDSITNADLYWHITRQARWDPLFDPYRFTQLWNARRNRRIRFDEDGAMLRAEVGTPPILNFMYWEDRFPNFSIYIFKRMLLYQTDPGAPSFYQLSELNHYFPASQRFYELCASVV